MKTLAFVSDHANSQAAQWQFDKIMAAIAFDVDLTLVFMPSGISQLSQFNGWKALSIYGINTVYFLKIDGLNAPQNNIHAQEINTCQLKKFMQNSDLIL